MALWNRQQHASSLEEHLRAYEREALAASHKTAGGALGAIRACSMAVGAVLGLAQPSLGAIQYSGPQNLPLDSSHATQTIDFSIPGQSATVRFDFYNPVPLRHICRMFAVVGKAQTPRSLMNNNAPLYSTNYVLGPTIANQWLDGAPNLNGQYGTPGYGSLWGNFQNTSGYVGVRFPVAGNPGHYYYGWVQYRGTTTNSTASGVIIDWAYEDAPDLAIAAGATSYAGSSDAAPVPALDEWGVLILFALLAGAGVMVSRRGRGKSAIGS